jgi:hypothetical protein
VNEPTRLPPVISPAVPQANVGGQSNARTPPRVRLHPFSGLLVILIDNIFFGLNAMTLGMGTPLACFLAFTVTTTGVYLTQRFLDRDSRGASLAKAFFAGVLAGVPTSISGTIFGTTVLFLSGLSAFNRKSN